MNIKSLNLALILLLFAGFSFTGNSSGNDPLPDSVPKNLVIRHSLSGGMVYYSESIYISEDSCFWEINDEGSVSKVYFALSTDEKDKLYTVFRDNKFDQITTHEIMVADRGGEDITLFWGKGRHASVSNSGISFIDDDWQDNWKACENALLEISTKESDKQKKNYEIRFDKSLYNQKLLLRLGRKILLKDTVLTSANDYIPIEVLLPTGTSKFLVSYNNGYFGDFGVNPDSSYATKIYFKNDTLQTQYVR